MTHEDKYGIDRRGAFIRQSALAATGIAFAALLSSAPVMAQATNQAYNTDNIGWNRDGAYIVNSTGTVPQCFKGETGKFDGPQLTGISDAANGLVAIPKKAMPGRYSRAPSASIRS